MAQHHSINYLEFPVKDIAATKAFFGQVFDWQFVDYGDDYCAIQGAGVDAGFYRADKAMRTAAGSGLLVIYSDNLAQSLQAVRAAGGEILQPIFAFPGGRRFHFAEPSGNEFAVWSDRP